MSQVDEEMSDVVIANLQQQINELQLELRNQPRSEATPAVVIADLQQQINELQLELRNRSRSEASPAVVINKEPAPRTPVLFRPSDLPKYDGSEDLYPAWRRAVLDTLGMEWNMFGYTDSRAFLSIYKSLEGSARRKASAFYEVGGVNGARRPEEFIEFLDRSNLDTTRLEKANNALHEMKMSENQRWASFFSTWANKLTEAQGDSWEGRIKIGLLRTALNSKLKTALAGNHLLPKSDYDEYIRIVSQVAHQIEDVSKRPKNTGRWDASIGRGGQYKTGLGSWTEGVGYGESSGGQNRPYKVGQIDSGGDTVMGGVNAAKASNNLGNQKERAKWKSPEHIARLRDEGLCFRCERRGCNTRICPLAPAVNPNKGRRPQVIALNLPPIDPRMIEVNEDDAKSMDSCEAEN